LLAEELDQPAHAESLQLRRERLGRAIEPLLNEPAARKAVGEFARALPERYVSTARPNDAARHLKLWLLARRTGFAAELRQPESGEAELTLVAADRPGPAGPLLRGARGQRHRHPRRRSQLLRGRHRARPVHRPRAGGRALAAGRWGRARGS